MSDSLKKDVLKAIADSKNSVKATTKEPAHTPVFKDPQMLQHSLDKSLQSQKETEAKD